MRSAEFKCFDVATFSFWKWCLNHSWIGPCFDINYWWYVFVDFELINVFQSIKFCVMEDNRLKKRVQSFLEPFARGFSYKKHLTYSYMNQLIPTEIYTKRMTLWNMCTCAHRKVIIGTLFFSLFAAMCTYSSKLLYFVIGTKERLIKASLILWLNTSPWSNGFVSRLACQWSEFNSQIVWHFHFQISGPQFSKSTGSK